MQRAICLLCLLFGLAGFAQRNELTLAISTEPPSLDPTTNAAGVIKLLLHHNLYESLVQVSEDGAFYGQLAASWEISADGLVYTFYLREGVKFQDGTPCDAEGVRRSFLRTMDPATRHPRPEYYRNIVAIEVPQPLVVQFKLKAPDASFLAILALGDSVVVPAHLGPELARRPVGTGPFKFAEARPGYSLRLVRNPDYYIPGVPKLEALNFRFIPDPSAQLAALRTGEVQGVAEMPAEIASTLQGDRLVRLVSRPQDLVQILAINTARPPLNDVRVRQALAHAIDRLQIIELVSYGFGSPIGSHLAPSALYYVDMTWVLPFNRARARELLAEAGFNSGLSLTLTLPSNYPIHVRTGEVIAAQLREVGIKAEIRLVDWGTWLERVFGQADYDLTVIAHVGRLDPAPMLTAYGPDRPEYYFRRGWSNPELDELLRQGILTPDPERRREIYARAQYILAVEAVNVFIQSPHQIVATRANVNGIKILPHYVLDLTAAQG